MDVQGITGSKVGIESIPYRSIVRFRIVSAGTFDLDAELNICVSSTAAPRSMKLSRTVDSVAIHRLLADRTIGR